MSEEKSNRAPVVFAGVKFYELLIETMREAKVASQHLNYPSWVQFLRTFDHITAGFRDDPELTKKLGELQVRAKSYTSMQTDRQFRLHGKGFGSKLHNEIMEVERKLYHDSADLLLKVGGDESLEWDENDLQKMMS